MTMLDTELARTEFAALRGEILLRIVIQNLQLMVLVLMMATLMVLAVRTPELAPLLMLIHVGAASMLALCWAHSGARTVQLAHYLTHLERTHKGAIAWETWHAANPFSSLLGSRWRISTWGVFLGSQAAFIALTALVLRPEQGWNWATQVAVAITLFTAFILPHPHMPEER